MKGIHNAEQTHTPRHPNLLRCPVHIQLPNRHSAATFLRPFQPCRATAPSSPDYSQPSTSSPRPTSPPTTSPSSTTSTSISAPTAPAWSRRATLLALPLCINGLLPGSWPGACGPLLAAPAPSPDPSARPLRSTAWFVPSELTILNDLDRPLKIYWLNYDGDAELFGALNPGAVFTVRTYESHAWRFVDAASGATLAEHVTAPGQQVVRLTRAEAAAAGAPGADGGAVRSRPTAPSDTVQYTYTTAATESSSAPPPQQQLGEQVASRGGVGGEGGDVATSGVSATEQEGEALGATPTRRVYGGGSENMTVAAFEGFDGLGNAEQQYCLAQLREIRIFPGGGAVLLALPGRPSSAPLELSLGGPEVLSLVSASGSLEQRRPSTLGTWSRTLMASGVELRRVCITRMVDGIYYCRLVLSRPDASLCSLDATPGDALSLALQLGRPVYVALEVARVHQSVMDVFSRRREAMEAAAAAGALDADTEAAADAAAQEALDAISRTVPTAPRPVQVLEMEQQLDA